MGSDNVLRASRLGVPMNWPQHWASEAATEASAANFPRQSDLRRELNAVLRMVHVRSSSQFATSQCPNFFLE